MPTYEYACKDCGRHLDVVQSFSDDPLTTCEACGGSLRKVFGAVGIAFKGSGFYKNDSRSSGNGKKSGPGKSSPKESSTSSEGTSSAGSSESGSSPATSSASSSSSPSTSDSKAASSNKAS